MEAVDGCYVAVVPIQDAVPGMPCDVLYPVAPPRGPQAVGLAVPTPVGSVGLPSYKMGIGVRAETLVDPCMWVLLGMGLCSRVGRGVATHGAYVGVVEFGRFHNKCSSVCRMVGNVGILAGCNMDVWGAFLGRILPHSDLLHLLALPKGFDIHLEAEEVDNQDNCCNMKSYLTCRARQDMPPQALNLQPLCWSGGLRAHPPARNQPAKYKLKSVKK